MKTNELQQQAKELWADLQIGADICRLKPRNETSLERIAEVSPKLQNISFGGQYSDAYVEGTIAEAVGLLKELKQKELLNNQNLEL